MLMRSIFAAVGLLAAAALAAVDHRAQSDPPAAPARFAATDLTLPVGRDRFVPVLLGAPADEARAIETTSDDPTVLAVVRPARVLGGQAIGYALVRPLREGETTLHAGGASVRIRAQRRPSVVLEEFDRPTIEGPSNGAAVWGRFSVGVSYWDLPAPRDGEPHAEHGAWLLVQGHEPIRPARSTTPDDGPLVHACFEVDAADLPDGPVRLVARIVDADGRERRSVPTVVRVLRADSAALHSGECEEDYGVDEANPYDRRQQSSRGAVQRDGSASGGRFFSNAGTYPRFGFPVEVERAGWYQLAIVAAADISMGTFPSVGIVINPGNATDSRPVTSGPVLARQWHRLALGTPFRLDEGRNIVRLHFMNDFYAGSGADRNLRLDRWELLRVADAAGPAPAHGGGAMMSMQAGGGGGGAMDAGATSGGMMAMMGDGAPGAGDGAAWPASVAAMNAGGEGPLRIAFAEVLDGRSIPGEVEIRGVVWQRGGGSDRDAARAPAPRVALLVNGREVAAQHAYAPRFRVDPSLFEPGANTLALSASGAGGLAARTPDQRVVWRGGPRGGGNAAPSSYHRFTIHDPAWCQTTRALRTGEKQPEERASAGLASNGTLVLTLPENLEGEFTLEAEAIGQNFDGPAVLEFATIAGDAPFDPAAPLPAAAGVLRVPTSWWGPHEVETRSPLRLTRGPKRLLVSFVNDKYEAGRGDRNAWFAAVSLVRARAPDAEARARSNVEIVYPRRGDGSARVFAQGAAVVEPSAPGVVRRLELLIDGEPAGASLDTARQPGPFVLPFSCAGLAPGRHALSVRAWGADGATFDSEPRPIEVLAEAPAEPTDHERVLIMLDRFAFGPSPRDLAEALTLGVEAYLSRALGAPADSDGELAANGLGATRFPNPRGEYDVARRVLSHALTTPNPARARFVLWAQNHFSTYIRKTEGRRKAAEHEAFARLGAAHFADLLRASATSPAMLRYLDQERSFARRINENYAREIMELHTLGVHGGYSQEDVTNLACILAGWSTSAHADGRTGPGGENAAEDRFRFDPRLSDPRPRTLLGVEFAETPARERFARADAALDLLAAHPSTARFVCRKLAAHYCCHNPPEDLVDHLASVFARTDGDMRAVLVEMARHPAFWREAVKRRVAHPLDFGVRMARVTGETNAHAVGEFLQSSGYGLFERPTPDGYPENDADAMSSNILLQRWRLARRAEWQLSALAPNELRYVDRRRDAPDERESRRIIDAVALRLTGRVLGEPSMAAALQVLAGTTGQREERVRAVATFVAQLPEAGVK